MVAVALAVLREGAETVLFVGGIVSGSHALGLGDVAVFSTLGVLAGAAAGFAIYSGLARLPARHVFAATNLLIALLAGSLASQLTKSLAQAGFIEGGMAPLWDTSAAVAPDSALGTLLHALVGYEARPSALQLSAYLLVLVSIYAGTRMLRSGPRTR